ncbi:MAG: NAD(P)/FAD-dependent oxidoreductase [Candidatus Bathyarchaeia archaeon]
MVKHDVVIIGAGVSGLATAYHIKRLKPDDDVLLVDRYGTAGQGNSGKSAACFRCFFASRTNLKLAGTSIRFYEHVQEDLNYDLMMKFHGYLWLLSEDRYKEIKRDLKTLPSMSIKYEEYDEEFLTRSLNMNTKVSGDEEARYIGLPDISHGVLIKDAGSLDPDSLVRFYEERARELGVKISYEVEVKSLLPEPKEKLGLPREPFFWQEPKVSGVKTSEGVYNANKIIVAAGAWSPKLLDPLGVDCHIKPKKRQIFALRAETDDLKKLMYVKGFNPEGIAPFVIFPKYTLWIKPVPKEDSFWVGYADDFPRAFKVEDDPQPERHFWECGIYPILIKYFPQFKEVKPFNSWAGQYAYNTIDCQPLIFEEHNLIFVGGGSGSGIMKADAMGRIAAALYAGEEYAELYGGEKFKVSDLGIKDRKTEIEKLVI